MLTQLSIRNIILIETLDIEFQKGLCVLTGETGAGKSILLDALGFALGQRGSARLLRAGQNQGSSTAVFDISKHKVVKTILSEQGIEVEDELFLRRVIYADGKSRAFINDAPVSIQLLASVAEHLVEIHGQHDQKGLLNPATHRSLLDEFAQLSTQLATVGEAYDHYRAASEELERLTSAEARTNGEEEYLRYVITEIERLAPKPGEEGELDALRKQLMNSGKISEAVALSYAVLAGQGRVDDTLRKAQNILLRSADMHPGFDAVIQAIERAAIEADEAIAQLEHLANNGGNEGERLEVVEERLFALRGAARKYNVTVEELAAYGQKMRTQLDSLEHRDEHIAKLKENVEKYKKQYIDESSSISKLRSKQAKSLEALLHKELAPMKMENARFSVAIEPLPETQWSRFGTDKISFMVSTNPGAPVAPLTKIASGGELSRFMLAMKVVLQGISSVPSIIFDEVDTGIGGAVADAVGKRLQQLGKAVQVLVITHQPQVAARGQYHLKVMKQQGTDFTTTSVKALSMQERTEEIARMLAGAKITGEARAAAESLLHA